MKVAICPTTMRWLTKLRSVLPLLPAALIPLCTSFAQDQLHNQDSKGPIAHIDYPFDLELDRKNDWGYYISPEWHWQRAAGARVALLDAGRECDNFRLENKILQLGSRGSAGCSSQVDKRWGYDEGSGANGFICGLFRPKGELHGHVNWYFPTIHSGWIRWDSYNEDDDEYTLNLAVDDANTGGQPGLLPDNRGLFHVEFAASETVNRFGRVGTDWWGRFRDAATHDHDRETFAYGALVAQDSRAQDFLGSKRAVVIGQFGIDTQHGFYSELHPVFAIAIRVDDNRSSERWAVFMRAMGTEGFCSDHAAALDSPSEIVLSLPWRQGAKSVSYKRYLDNAEGVKWSGPAITVQRGVEVALHIRPSVPVKRLSDFEGAQYPLYGELELQWIGETIADTISKSAKERLRVGIGADQEASEIPAIKKALRTARQRAHIAGAARYGLSLPPAAHQEALDIQWQSPQELRSVSPQIVVVRPVQPGTIHASRQDYLEAAELCGIRHGVSANLRELLRSWCEARQIR